MKKTDLLVIGGSAAGVTASLTARKYNKDASITVVRKEKEVLVPCGIPYMYGTLPEPTKNIIPDNILLSKNIEIVVDEVKSLNRDEKTVTLSKG
ncbi:MAG: pyridine nucleotide-disulfide oxidoreductase, partial [Candidatus Hecatellales archaeon]